MFWILFASGASAAPGSALPVIDLVAGQSAREIKDDIRFTRARRDGPPVSTDLASVEAVSHASTQFGTVGQPVYVFLRLRNAGAEPGSWILTTGRSTISDFILYRQAGDGWRVILNGDDLPQLGAVLYQYQAYSTEIDLAPGEEAIYAIRFRDEVSAWMPLKIQNFGDFFTARRSNIALVAGVVTGSLILALFNVILLAATGRRVFVWLGLAEAAFAFNTLHAEGYLSIFWLYRQPELQALFGDLTRVSFGLLMLQFGREFLATRSLTPRYDRFLRAIIVLGVLVVLGALLHLVTPIVPIMQLHAAGWIFALIASSALPVIGWVATRRYGMHFAPLLIGWAALAIYINSTALAISGLVPFLAVNWHWIGPIGLFECLMATLTTGLHLRNLQHDRLAAEREAKHELLARIAITEDAKRLAEERAKALTALKSRDRLIEMSAHDTRHVLHALSSTIFYARQTGRDLPPSALMTLIEASARHLEEILGSSITVDHGEGPFLALGLVDVGRLLDELVTIYSAAALNSSVVISSQCDRGMRIIADEALLVRVLSNLLNNALRATQSGRIEITCQAADNCVALRITDTGTGMTPEIADYLRSDSECSGCEVMPEGFGKGWRAIRETILLLLGSYTVETGPRGTCVTVTLPLLVDQEHPISQSQLAQSFPQICFMDQDAGTQSDTEGCLDALDPEQVRVFIADRATSESRVRAATLGRLLLVRPLVQSMMEHPYVVELISSSARARSTS